jgi:uncharacterized protein YggE
MKNKIIIPIIGTTLLLLVVSLAGCDTFSTSSSSSSDLKYLGNISQQNTGIWVTGTGKISVVPDIAEINIGVETQAVELTDAQQEAAGAMESIMSALGNYAISEKDITTTSYNIYPVYNYDDKGVPTLAGYRVNNTVTVKIRNLDNTGAIIDSVTTAGKNATRINSISFSVDSPEKYDKDLRDLAMADAETKAKQLASLGKVKLGKATYITESGGSIPPIIYRMDSNIKESAQGIVTPISTGELEVTLTVEVIYTIS